MSNFHRKKYDKEMSNYVYPAFMAAMLLTMSTSEPALAASVNDPPVFSSNRGTLDLVMIAGAVQTKLTDTVNTAAWVYEVCQRTTPRQLSCPVGSAHPLGGVRLQLTQGDTLKVRLVNKLPPATDAVHVAQDPAVFGNPTNLHTHGLIVEPHRAEGPNDTYGDYIFLEVLNPANPTSPPIAAAATSLATHATHNMGLNIDILSGAVDYAIQIPRNHPSGQYFFHPHVHGLAVNQISAGLSGIITIGTPDDMCGEDKCRTDVRAGAIRHLVLKDMQILPGNILKTQADPTFCSSPNPAASPTDGFCAGTNGPNADYTGGTWFHTVNGQVFPKIEVNPKGDIWRIQNSSPNRSYALSVDGDTKGTPVLMQLLAIDGVAIDSLALSAQGAAAMEKLLGGKARPVACPLPAGYSGSGGLCAAVLRMMPGARAEVRVVKQNEKTATFRTAEFFTGGDTWPAVDLAQVTFGRVDDDVMAPLVLGGQGRDALSATGVLMAQAELQPRGSLSLASIDVARAAANLPVTGSAHQEGLVPATSFVLDSDTKLGLKSTPNCAPLREGHHRRIYFGNPTPGQDGFGLGYVEIDEKGREIAATAVPVSQFNLTNLICLPLGPNGEAVKEVWEVVNLTAEDHNFHIHQTKFRLLAGGAFPGTTIPTQLPVGLVLHDSVPLPRAANTGPCDGTVVAFTSGACRPVVVVAEIPFREIGDFVYHCHILEHEDGGMMSSIRVIASPKRMAAIN
jgi:L-ascorbate oxidase